MVLIMRKILITASTFPRWEGDTEPRFILDYAKAMTKYYEVHVLVPMAPGAKKEEKMEGVYVHRYHYFPIHKWETLCYPGAIVPRIKEKKIRAFLVPFLLLCLQSATRKYSKQVDLVHAHWLVPQGVVQSNINNIPYIVTGHGGDVASLNMWPLKQIKRRVMLKASACVGVSSYICEKMHSICPKINIFNISMGCDTSKFSPSKRDENFFSHEKKNIVFVGRLVEIKGIEYLVEAMEKIDANLYIIGKGPLEETLKAKVNKLFLKDKVYFLGAKTHEELPVIMASADLLVAPSIISSDGAQEGLPVSIMEAMASGVPVVVGASGGTKDIIAKGKNGYIVDATDINELSSAINRIICDDELRREMGREAFETSRKYSYATIAELYYDLFRIYGG